MKNEPQTAVEALGLEKFRRHISLCINATEPKCCPRGPIAIVYPEGARHHSCTSEVLECSQ